MKTKVSVICGMLNKKKNIKLYEKEYLFGIKREITINYKKMMNTLTIYKIQENNYILINYMIHICRTFSLYFSQYNLSLPTHMTI